MKFIDWFSGIGGFREGFTQAGHECVGFCEYDKYAVASYTSMYLITEEQREYLATLPLKQRQEEILKEEYRNGEWYRQDIRAVNAGDVPRADIWAFGSPCQDFSLAGRRAGLQGDRSSLIREIFRLISETVEELRPKWLVYENVKGMLSSNGGRDYLAILTEMDRWGYDTEWCLINSKEYVPQNRERIYTVGHLRAYGRKEIFPIEGSDGKDSVHGIEQVGQLKSERSNSNGRVNSVSVGIAPTLSTMEGGGREPHIIEELAPQRERERNADCRRSSERWTESENNGNGRHTSGSECNGLQAASVGSDRVILIGNTHPSGHGMNGNVFSSEGLAPTVTTNKGEGNKIAIRTTANLPQDEVLTSGGGGYTESNVICMDKTIFGKERRIANTITAREDRGISARNQEGTAIGIIVNEDTK